MSECPICFEVMGNDNNKIKTECGHEFHSNCFLTNVAHNGFSCPCCRKELAQTPCSCEMYDYDEDTSEDEDTTTEYSEDEEESEINEEEYLVAPLDYMIDKLQQKYSKRDLLKLIYNYYNEDLLEECVSIDSKFFSDFMKTSCDYISLKKEEKENELMTMEDKNYKPNEETKLVDDFETIINTRVY